MWSPQAHVLSVLLVGVQFQKLHAVTITNTTSTTNTSSTSTTTTTSTAATTINTTTTTSATTAIEIEATCSAHSCPNGYFSDQSQSDSTDVTDENCCEAWGCIGIGCNQCVAQELRTSATDCVSCNNGYVLDGTTCKAICTVPNILVGAQSWSGLNCASGSSNVREGTTCDITPTNGYICTSPGLCGTSGQFANTASCQASCATYVCPDKRDLEPAHASSTDLSVENCCQDCKAGWTLVDERCYLQVDDERNFAAAEAVCESKGSTLAKIETANQSLVAASLIQSGDSMIGYKDKQWSDGIAPCFLTWQPDWFSNVASCTRVKQTEIWDDWQCNKPSKFLCSYDRVDYVYVCSTTSTTPTPIDANIESDANETKYGGTITVDSSLNKAQVEDNTKTSLSISFVLSEDSIDVTAYEISSDSAGSRLRRLVSSWLVAFTLTVPSDDSSEAQISTTWRTLQTNPSVLKLNLITTGIDGMEFTSFGLIASTTTAEVGLPNININNWQKITHEWATTTGVPRTTAQAQTEATTGPNGGGDDASAQEEYVDKSGRTSLSMVVYLAAIMRVAKLLDARR